MRTRSSNRRRSRQQKQQQLTPDIVEVPEIPMADNRTMVELLQAPTGGDSLNSAAGGYFFDKMPNDCLRIIESKAKVRHSRNAVSRVSTNAPLSSSSPSNSFELQQIAANLEDKMEIRMSRLEKSINEMKALVVTPPATVKAVEEICVTCGANHNFNNCPLTRGGYESPVFHDNLHQF
ncbi:hypothetical protein Tco_1467358 [Tanacetum coccineum]